MCEHHNFESSVAVGRLTDGPGGPVKSFTADIKIRCTDCGTDFMFKGLRAGVSPSTPTVSVDGTEARMPIGPVGSEMSALDHIAAGVMVKH